MSYDLQKINRALDSNQTRLESFTFMEELGDDLDDNDFTPTLGGDEQGTPNDELGDEFDLDDAMSAGNAEEADIVDDAIMDIMDMLVDNDYPEETAEEAVFDAIATLVNDGSISDTPDADASDDEKVSWKLTSIPKIKSRLKELGLQFDETI
jgi:hypothetical protein